MSPNYGWRGSPGDGGSLDDELEGFEKYVALFSDRINSDRDVIAKGDKVVIKSISKVTHTGYAETTILRGVPATGKKAEETDITIARVENGKIVEIWEASDDMNLFEQPSLELRPKEEKKK